MVEAEVAASRSQTGGRRRMDGREYNSVVTGVKAESTNHDGARCLERVVDRSYQAFWQDRNGMPCAAQSDSRTPSTPQRRARCPYWLSWRACGPCRLLRRPCLTVRFQQQQQQQLPTPGDDGRNPLCARCHMCAIIAWTGPASPFPVPPLDRSVRVRRRLANLQSSDRRL